MEIINLEMANLIILFNHSLTPTQITDAKENLHIKEIITPPVDLREMWANIPPDIADLSQTHNYVTVQNWLLKNGTAGDYVLIQGDFGATYLMVRFAFKQGHIPIYSTTRRQAEEQHSIDGSVKMTHRFNHVRFRCYQAIEEK